MSRIRRWLPGVSLIAFLLLASCSGPAPIPDPTLTSVTPTRIPADGGTLTITGSNFFDLNDRLTVETCGVALAADLTDPEERVVVLPPGKALRVAWGDELEAAFATGGVVGTSDVTLVRPDGKRAVLPNAVECFDPTPFVSHSSVNGGKQAGPNRVTLLQFTVENPTGDALSCSIDPGDGSAPMVIDPCAGKVEAGHVYSAIDTYRAVLELQDDSGRSGRHELTVNITNTPPVARFTFEPSDPGYYVPLTVDFDASGSIDLDGHALSYSWSFGDGDTGSGATTSKAYSVSGSFDVTLTVSDSLGASSSTTSSITVKPAVGSLKVTLSGLPADVESVDLQLTGTDSYSLDISDGGTFENIPRGSYSLSSDGATRGYSEYSADLPTGSVEIKPGETTSVSVPFDLILGTLDHSITGLPADLDADVSVSGPSGSFALTESDKLTDLIPGEYSIQAEKVVDGDESYAPTATADDAIVRSGESTSSSTAYELLDGTLDIEITGLPEGVDADVDVTGGSYSANLTSSASLSLPPGSYQVTAGNVSVDGLAYLPSKSSQTVTIASEETSSVSIAYTAKPSTLVSGTDPSDDAVMVSGYKTELTGMQAIRTGSAVQVTLDFAAAPVLSEGEAASGADLSGVIFIDVDQDPLSGSPLGSEYKVDLVWLYSQGFAIYRTTGGGSIGYATTELNGNSLTIGIPLDVIEDNGLVGLYTEITIGNDGVTDEGPAGGSLLTN